LGRGGCNDWISSLSSPRPKLTEGNTIMIYENELIIDNFAGGGGASTGIEMALNRPVDIAINHDREAISMHEANHPTTKHYCEDVWDVNPREICNGRPVGLAWFSPDCKHFSKAKGGKPVEKKIRGLAWVAIRWAATVKPRIIILENVEEFSTWGPLLKNGQPCPDRKGQTFNAFVTALQKQGYNVEWRELKADDYGTPTIRKRLFLIARRDGKIINWPQPTHGAEGSGLKPYKTAADCIQWDIKCPSIFERKRPLVPKTLLRIAKGLKKFVFECDNPFTVELPNGDIECSHIQRQFGNSVGSDVNNPVGTITAGGNKTGICTAFLTECANGSSQRVFDLEEPLRTQCAQVKGGHFALCTAFIIKHFGGATGSHVKKPFPTLTTRGTQNQVLTTTMKPEGEKHKNRDNVRAFLIKYYGNEKEAADIQKPFGSITTKDRFGLVTVKGVLYEIVDIGMRMITAREAYRAQGFPESYIIDKLPCGKKLGKTAQMRMCGNSVCPTLAKALVGANYFENRDYQYSHVVRLAS
jgi:DNA (cytosine-5)-methyltransferase 1